MLTQADVDKYKSGDVIEFEPGEIECVPGIRVPRGVALRGSPFGQTTLVIKGPRADFGLFLEGPAPSAENINIRLEYQV